MKNLQFKNITMCVAMFKDLLNSKRFLCLCFNYKILLDVNISLEMSFAIDIVILAEINIFILLWTLLII